MSFFSHKSTARSDIEREIHRLSDALDSLKREAARESDHRFDALRRKMESLWDGSHLEQHGAHLRDSAVDAGRLARDCARDHPVTTLALAAGAVALIGYLATRR